MNELVKEYTKKFKTFFHDYGKILTVAVLTVSLVIGVAVLADLVSPKKLRVTFFDVGQGDAIFVQTPSGHDLLIDGGRNEKVLSALASSMEYFDRDIDVMVVTHPDADHITGLIGVLEDYKVHTIITSPVNGDTELANILHERIAQEGANVHIARRGDQIDFGDGVILRVLYPSKSYDAKKGDTNDASVSVVITYGDESFLLTGDLPTTHEDELLTDKLPRNITIYKAGHHGSRSSSGEQLLSYIKPEYAVISAGKDNTYGHPNKETLERLAIYSKEILSTIDKGTITFLLNGNNAEVRTER